MAQFVSGSFDDSSPEHAPDGAVPSDAGAGGGEGHLTSRPPPNPNSYGGEDYLALSLYLRHARFRKLVETLDVHRSAAENDQRAGDELELAGQKFLVLPIGAKASAKRGKAYFRWQLQSETGYTIQLMNREACDDTLPNGKLIAKSLVLIQFGAVEVVRQAKAALAALGASIARDKVSRVDVCCDLPGRTIPPLKEAFEARHYVSRAHASDQHHLLFDYTEADYSVYHHNTMPTSINLGRSNVRLRIYEKVQECQHDLAKRQAMIKYRWGVFPYQAIRVEYQLRREKLKQLGVDSFADWMVKRSTIAHYLTHDWFRLTAGPVDGKHPDRTPVLPEWIEVQSAYAAAYGDGPLVELGPIATLQMPADHYVKSAVGLFISLFANLGTVIDTNETFWNQVLFLVLDDIELRDIPAEVKRRILELGVASPKEDRC